MEPIERVDLLHKEGGDICAAPLEAAWSGGLSGELAPVTNGPDTYREAMAIAPWYFRYCPACLWPI